MRKKYAKTILRTSIFVERFIQFDPGVPEKIVDKYFVKNYPLSVDACSVARQKKNI